MALVMGNPQVAQAAPAAVEAITFRRLSFVTEKTPNMRWRWGDRSQYLNHCERTGTCQEPNADPSIDVTSAIRQAK